MNKLAKLLIVFMAIVLIAAFAPQFIGGCSGGGSVPLPC